MELVVDVEADGFDPSQIWCVVCQDVQSGVVNVFRYARDSAELLRSATRVVGHNLFGYDLAVLERLAGIRIDPDRVVDTLVVSRLVDFSRPGGHSLAAWGAALGIPKLYAKESQEFFSKWSPELEARCVSDVSINTGVYLRLKPYIDSPRWSKAIAIESYVARVCRELHSNGFAFDKTKALDILDRLTISLSSLDVEIRDSFRSRFKLIREITPRITKHGTIARNSIPKSLGPDLTVYHPGCPFSLVESEEFNPGSPQQVVQRLNEAGWRPTEKTKGHREALKDRTTPPEKLAQYAEFGWALSDENLSTLPDTAPRGARKLAERRIIASRVSKLNEWLAAVRPVYDTGEATGALFSQEATHTAETNENDVTGQSSGLQRIDSSGSFNGSGLAGVPESVSMGADRLDGFSPDNQSNKISGCKNDNCSETQRQNLLSYTKAFSVTERFGDRNHSCQSGHTERRIGHWRVHGEFFGIGAWTGRVSHSKPNMANVPTRKPKDTPEIAALNDELRTLWIAGPGRLLVGVDADQIQLRVLAHYLQDERFTNALVNGRKEDGTDVHSLNVGVIGPACRGRRDAKTFIYAWVLGAGDSRVADILGTDRRAAKDVDRRFVEYYPGLKTLREHTIARDAARGCFQGLDGRFVKCFGKDESEQRHYMLGGYLQNGEKLIMAYAMQMWEDRLRKEKIPYLLVDWVHDEWQLEVPEDEELARYVSLLVSNSIAAAGELLGTLCPMKGSVLGGHDRLAIGKNWLETH